MRPDHRTTCGASFRPGVRPGSTFGRADFLRRLVVVGMASAVPASCGDLTAGGAAESEVVVVGDTPSQGSPRAPAPRYEAEDALHAGQDGAPASGSSGGPARQITHPFEGTVSARLRVFLLPAGGQPTDVSGGERMVQVDVRGEDEAHLGTIQVTPGAYDGARVVFSSVTANLTAGLDPLPPLGGGVVTVDFGTQGSIAVDSSIPFNLSEEGRVRVTVDLRSPEWLSLVAGAPLPLVVTAADFAARIGIESRVD